MKGMTFAERYHDFSAGHRVAGHENKCAHLHGHNYRTHFKVGAPKLDGVGRVLDFSVIKSKLCMWLEDNWDHKMLIWENDPLCADLKKLVPDDIVVVPFNPTAENMAEYLVEEVSVDLLSGTGCILVECKIEETRKCSAIYTNLH
jgi:6-pyruvoyltetrahydropterin/6-carboxytetrahydropterin synthase